MPTFNWEAVLKVSRAGLGNGHCVWEASLRKVTVLTELGDNLIYVTCLSSGTVAWWHRCLGRSLGHLDSRWRYGGKNDRRGREGRGELTGESHSEEEVTVREK